MEVIRYAQIEILHQVITVPYLGSDDATSPLVRGL